MPTLVESNEQPPPYTHLSFAMVLMVTGSPANAGFILAKVTP